MRIFGLDPWVSNWTPHTGISRVLPGRNNASCPLIQPYGGCHRGGAIGVAIFEDTRRRPVFHLLQYPARHAAMVTQDARLAPAHLTELLGELFAGRQHPPTGNSPTAIRARSSAAIRTYTVSASTYPACRATSSATASGREGNRANRLTATRRSPSDTYAAYTLCVVVPPSPWLSRPATVRTSAPAEISSVAE